MLGFTFRALGTTSDLMVVSDYWALLEHLTFVGKDFNVLGICGFNAKSDSLTVFIQSFLKTF